MTDKEIIAKAKKRIDDEGFADNILTVDNVFSAMKTETLYDIAEVLADFNNLVCDLRDILEGVEE